MLSAFLFNFYYTYTIFFPSDFQNYILQELLWDKERMKSWAPDPQESALESKTENTNIIIIFNDLWTKFVR